MRQWALTDVWPVAVQWLAGWSRAVNQWSTWLYVAPSSATWTDSDWDHIRGDALNGLHASSAAFRHALNSGYSLGGCMSNYKCWSQSLRTFSGVKCPENVRVIPCENAKENLENSLQDRESMLMKRDGRKQEKKLKEYKHYCMTKMSRTHRGCRQIC